MISTTISHKPEVIEKMRPDLKPFIEARNTAIILNLDRKKYLEVLEKDVRRVYEGLEKEIKGSLWTICDRIYELIKERFKSLSVGEFTILCTNGIMGDYGFVKVVNVNMFGTWIKEFCLSQKRMEAFREYFSLEGQLGSEVKLSPQESEKIVVSGLIKEFEGYKEKKEKRLMLNPKLVKVYYDLLEEKELVNWNDYELKEIEGLAKAMLKKNLEPDILDGICGKHTMGSMCRLIALKKWFDTLIKDNRSINQLIK